ncbi:MAG: hypothetical protein J6K88_05315 [Oscillospiraceae bacterium]|nr:hypothetical protein [Oscillospiraceae bacterium]
MKKNRVFSAVLALVMLCSVFCVNFSAEEIGAAGEGSADSAGTKLIYASDSYLEYSTKYASENRDVSEIKINAGEYLAE